MYQGRFHRQQYVAVIVKPCKSILGGCLSQVSLLGPISDSVGSTSEFQLSQKRLGLSRCFDSFDYILVIGCRPVAGPVPQYLIHFPYLDFPVFELLRHQALEFAVGFVDIVPRRCSGVVEETFVVVVLTDFDH